MGEKCDIWEAEGGGGIVTPNWKSDMEKAVPISPIRFPYHSPYVCIYVNKIKCPCIWVQLYIHMWAGGLPLLD